MRQLSADELKERVPFDREALDAAIEEQAGLFLQAAELVALAVSRRDDAKTLMDQEYARACNRARTDITSGDKKTEAGVKEAAQLDKRYIQAESAYLVAKHEAELVQTVREAFDMRGKMLREMAQLYISGYYQLSAVGDRAKRGVDDVAARGARKILNDARRERQR